MKLVSIIVLLLLPEMAISSEFGDLVPIPTAGDKWEFIRLDNENITKIEILEATPAEVVIKRMSGGGEYITKAKYSIENGVCYILSIETYDVNNKKDFHHIVSTTPPTRCYVNKEEMPFREKYVSETKTPSGKILGKEQRDRTYYFRGTEEITTPSGKYLAEKVDIIGDKLNRTVWRNTSNRIIKHRVKVVNSGEEVKIMLYKGQSK